jgi:glucosyl-dolichyl phosphate glucuronosyltransferase
MKLTIAICTWNRAALLDQTLASFESLVIPAHVTWEIVIVDNNCTDNTADIIAKYKSKLPVIGLKETKQGQSHARNCATDAANGEIIIWTDDDVLPEPNWIVNYVAAFERHPDAAFFGGRIEPWYEEPPPRWIEEHRRQFEGMLVIRDIGPTERPFHPGSPPDLLAETPFGANMAIRTVWQRRFQYDPNLGKVKNSNVTADETDLFRRIREAGGIGIWVPDAAIRHFVMKQRMTTTYLWDYHFGQGQTLARTNVYVLPWNTPVFNHAPRWMVMRKYQSWLKSWLKWFAGNTSWSVWYQRYARYTGLIHEYRAQRWVPPPKPTPMDSTSIFVTDRVALNIDLPTPSELKK